MRFRVGYHFAEPIGKGDNELYDVERGIGTDDRCCVANVEQLRKLKRKTYDDEMETSGPKDRWKSEADQRRER